MQPPNNHAFGKSTLVVPFLKENIIFMYVMVEKKLLERAQLCQETHTAANEHPQVQILLFTLEALNVSAQLMTSISPSPDVSCDHLTILQMRNLTKSFCTVLEIEPRLWI